MEAEVTSPAMTSLPTVLAATRGLRLAARQLVAGLLPGAQESRRVGSSHEFSQARPYQPGDDPRRIDWRLFARSDRYFLRESELETAVSVRLVLDATASMRHADVAGPGAGVRKFDLARVLAAALATLAHTAGDPIGLLAVGDGRVVADVAPNRRGEPLERVLRTLAALEPAGGWPADARALAASLNVGGGHPNRALVVVLTDGHEHPAGEIRAALAPLRARHHETLLFQLVGRDEVEWPFHGPVRGEDWETGAVVETDADAARAAYLAGQEELRAAWQRWAAEGGDHLTYARFRTDEPAERVLRAYLRRRVRWVPPAPRF